jgi:hypothetical protein
LLKRFLGCADELVKSVFQEEAHTRTTVRGRRKRSI